jgi:ceramide glucosyltransferase
MILANLAAGFCAIATCVHLATVAIAGLRCRRTARPAPSEAIPAVTLLRPICGLDNFATETLASSFRLEHPACEIIFCAAREDDPAIPIVRRLLAANPQAPARLLIGNEDTTANPKLDNLVKGWDAAAHDWIVMADSNALLPPDSIGRLVAAWRRDTGLVCSMPLGTRPENFWAELECAFLNTLQARYQYFSEALGWGFAQGKTMLFRRAVIDRTGGIRALAAETAEDAATTKLVRAAGLRVRLVDTPFEQPLGRRRLGEVWARQLRWARLRRMSFPLLFLAEAAVGNALPSAALVIAASAYGVNAALAVALFIATWISAEAALALGLGWRFAPRTAVALLLRDLLLPAMWIAAWLGDDYVWRGTRITASSSGEGSRLTPQSGAVNRDEYARKPGWRAGPSRA